MDGLPAAVDLVVSAYRRSGTLRLDPDGEHRIIYRVYLVFQKPVDELEEVLGIDVPPMPDISLSSITSNTILLYWKPPENYHSPLRQSIQINGITGKIRYLEKLSRNSNSTHSGRI